MNDSLFSEQELEELKGLLAGRATTYRMFSRLYLRPLEQQDIEEFVSMELEKKASDIEDAPLLAEGFNDMGRGLHRRHTGTKSKLNTDYTMCFGGISAMHDLRAIPYASLFIGKLKGDKAELFQEPFRAARAAYRSECIGVDKDLNIPDDHLSFELSFMADLSEKILAAVENGDVPEALRLVGVSAEFLSGQIMTWYPEFMDLALTIIETRFYRGVLKATSGYLQLDGETLAELKDVFSSVEQ